MNYNNENNINNNIENSNENAPESNFDSSVLVGNFVKRKVTGLFRYFLLILAAIFGAAGLLKGSKGYVIIAIVFVVVAVGSFVYSIITYNRFNNELRKDPGGNKLLKTRDRVLLIPLIITLIYLAFYFIKNILPLFNR